ncbi:MAG: ECF transporter S component [Oscillospiraceae bacterium]|nr:ECF transporter S component [Oscillospiraceae bacterium]
MRTPVQDGKTSEGSILSVKIRSNSHDVIRNLAYSALCLALCMVLPFFTGQIPQIGSMLCPMHIPVLLAGFLCGPWWAAAVGAVAPMLRYLIFSMPPPLPTGLAMTFELFTYGLAGGLLYRKLPKKTSSVYLALLSAMLMGRGVWGLVCILIYGAMGQPFTWAIFLAGAFTNALPGIALHLILIPILVLTLKKAKIIAK